MLPHTTEIHEAPFSCVLALAGKVWQHQSAVERGLSAFGTVFLGRAALKEVRTGAALALMGRPAQMAVDRRATQSPLKCCLAGIKASRDPKASSPVRAQTTPANGLHGLNPINTGTSTPEDAPFGLFVRDRATLRVQRWKRALLGMNDFLQGLWVERLGAGRIPIHPW